MASYSPQLKVGLLGGGQLARMLAQSAQNFGLEPHVLSSNKQDPAAQVTAHWHQGSIDNQRALETFLRKMDIATFESEFLNSKVLMKAEKNSGTRIFPSTSLMGLLQDRKTQKEKIDQFKIPTSPWMNIATEEDIEKVVEEIGLPLVFKKRRFGYDGYGTFIVKTKKDLRLFIEKHFQDDLFIAEKFIPFKRELAVIMARSRDKSITHLPFVESKQKEARCFWVKGPVTSQGFRPVIQKFKNFLQKTNYVGVIGVEFFDTGQQILVNEVAPRVHNTGHYSINTSGPSQFDLHWMCLLGQKLPASIATNKGFAMVNLIGNKRKKIKIGPELETHLHWYGKSENRQGRKMGHINSLGKTPEEALKKALQHSKRCLL